MNDFNLPKISEELDKEEFDYRNKYRNIYIRLIIKCQNMTDQELSGYNEKHHILPKCLGGGNEEENLVLMPVRYHIIAHMVLAKAFPEDRGLQIAVFCMFSLGNSERKAEIEKRYSSRLVSEIRAEIAKSTSGENSPNYGIVRSEEFREKVRQANLGKKANESTKRKMSEARRGEKNANFGKHLSKETKQKISEKNKGRKLTEDQLKIWSECKKGEKNANFGKHLSDSQKTKISNTVKEAWERGDYDKYKDHLNQHRGKSWCAKKIVGPDGTIYDCLLDAVDSSGIPNSTLRGWMKSGPEGKNGWRYLNPEDSLTRKQKKSQSD